jgi:protein involved in polysaccharide export with SLBB domain
VGVLAVAAVFLAFLAAGCAQNELGRYSGYWRPSLVVKDPTRVRNPIVKTDAYWIQKDVVPEEQFPGPTPDDLKASTADYILGPGDLVDITVFELMAPGQPYVTRERISQSGQVTFPYLGVVKAAGLATRGLEEKLADMLEPDYIRNPQVTVFVLEYRNLNVSVLTGVFRPGLYPMSKQDMTLLELVAMAGSVVQLVEDYGYVIRKYSPDEADLLMLESGLVPKEGAVPAEKGAAPAEKGAAPAEKGAAPAEKGAAPAEKGAAPAEKGAAPAEKGAVPAEKGAAPAEKGAAPAVEKQPAGKTPSEGAPAAPEKAAPAPTEKAAPEAAPKPPEKAAPVPTEEAAPEAAPKPPEKAAPEKSVAPVAAPASPEKEKAGAAAPVPKASPEVDREAREILEKMAEGQMPAVSKIEAAEVAAEKAPAATKAAATKSAVAEAKAPAAVAKAPSTGSGRVEPTQVAAAPAKDEKEGHWVWSDGKWIELKPPEVVPAPAAAATAGKPPEAVKPPEATAVAKAGEEAASPEAARLKLEEKLRRLGIVQGSGQLRRIIRFDVTALQAGDPTQNVVLRDGDVVTIPSPPVGDFYMAGEVARPGVYSLTGRKITLLQAVAAAGGTTAVAVPWRTEVVRRLAEGEEEIIYVDLNKIARGEVPDFYLHPEDLVRIGTDQGAIFNAVLRNAFRATYGLGAVYDTNFADFFPWSAAIHPFF